MFRRRKQQNDKGAPKWMVTFSDMMTLILVFFILLFSMSVVDAEKFRVIAESFQQRQVLDFLPSAVELDHSLEEEKSEPTVEEIEEVVDEMDDLLKEVQRFLEKHKLTDMISATRDDRGVVLVLQEKAVFLSGEADILPDAELFLDKVGTLLKSVPNLVKVEGHTDARPISTFRFPSNWELSGARASSVIRYLVDEHNLNSNRFVAIGYGDTQPVAPNTTEDNLQLNRRVVIVISDPKANGDF
ncbi:flagellar motor protein MotS [Bacillus alkalicellulosilyticus]|uniref:flagellar motor protein MotS n=1 Tax=Alkalihalobacterium alkalicellulosilyticum TaxID=1912214 RepID=UPI000996E863|nr:flagellar motor protein MotS [Bacillus alkalicellulosilyticus]